LTTTKAALHVRPPIPTAKKSNMRARRAFYFRNRSTGEEYIQFSSERGKPMDEVKIDISRPRRIPARKK